MLEESSYWEKHFSFFSPSYTKIFIWGFKNVFNLKLGCIMIYKYTYTAQVMKCKLQPWYIPKIVEMYYYTRETFFF